METVSSCTVEVDMSIISSLCGQDLRYLHGRSFYRHSDLISNSLQCVRNYLEWEFIVSIITSVNVTILYTTP